MNILKKEGDREREEASSDEELSASEYKQIVRYHNLCSKRQKANEEEIVSIARENAFNPYQPLSYNFISSILCTPEIKSKQCGLSKYLGNQLCLYAQRNAIWPHSAPNQVCTSIVEGQSASSVSKSIELEGQSLLI